LKNREKIVADYMVGRSGGKDRYMVGYNAEGKSGYKVGGGGSSVGQSSNESLGGGDQASPAGAKSAFSYKDIDTKDVGDRSDNMNFGGSIANGVRSETPSQEFSESGDWSVEKDAMARRKAMMESAAKYMSNKEYNTPTADIMDIKKS
jgi:hypothetical protein